MNQQFSCRAGYCHKSLVLVWLFNGSVPEGQRNSLLRVGSSGSNENITDCTNTLDVLPDFLNPFTVQCVAVYVCDPANADVSGCHPRVCHSPLLQVTTDGKILYVDQGISSIFCLGGGGGGG